MQSSNPCSWPMVHPKSNIIATAHMARLGTVHPAKITFQIRKWWWTSGFSGSQFSDMTNHDKAMYTAELQKHAPWHVPPTGTSGGCPQLGCTEDNAWNDSRARQKCNPGERRAYTAAVKPGGSTITKLGIYSTHGGLKPYKRVGI